MSVRIVCINKDNGNHMNPQEAITDLGWVNETTGETGKSTRLQMYDYIKNGGTAYVKDVLGNVAYLEAVENAFGTKFVRTIPDRTKTDNLLTLGECR